MLPNCVNLWLNFDDSHLWKCFHKQRFADFSYKGIFLTLKKKVFPSQLHLVKTVSMGEGIPQTSVILRGGDGGLSGFSIQK